MPEYEEIAPVTDLLGTLRPEFLKAIDETCPEQQLHRLLVMAENYLIDTIQEGARCTSVLRNLVFTIKHLFNIRIRLSDLQDRVRIRQQREEERREAKRLKEQQKAEEKQRKHSEKEATKNAIPASLLSTHANSEAVPESTLMAPCQPQDQRPASQESRPTSQVESMEKHEG